MNSPHAAGGEKLRSFCSSEGAEYNYQGKYFSSGVIPLSRRRFLYSSSNVVFL